MTSAESGRENNLLSLTAATSTHQSQKKVDLHLVKYFLLEQKVAVC